MSHHKYAVDTAELAVMLAACAHTPLPTTAKPWTLESVSYSWRGAPSCAMCLDPGQAAVVEMKFGGRFPHSSARRASRPHLHETCVSVDRMRPQQSSMCGMDVEAGACFSRDEIYARWVGARRRVTRAFSFGEVLHFVLQLKGVGMSWHRNRFC